MKYIMCATSGTVYLVSVAVYLFAPYTYAHMSLILRADLDNEMLNAVTSFEEEIISNLKNGNMNNDASSSIEEMDLKPLYFHVHGITVSVSELHLTCSNFKLRETNLDVFGRKMLPEVIFKWIQVDGRVKMGSDGDIPQIFGFRLVEDEVRGEGVASLESDISSVAWAHLNFKPKSSKFQTGFIDGGISMEPSLPVNIPEFGNLLNEKLQRDIDFHLTRVVSKMMNKTLKRSARLTNMEFDSDTIREIMINNTQNANTFIDSLLKYGGEMIREKFNDRIKIPDIHESFGKKILVVKLEGSFTANQGSVIGTSSVYRMGDVVFGYDDDSQINFYGTLGFEALHLYYDHYKAELLGMGPSGTLDTKLSPISLLVQVHLNTTSKVIYLDKFKVANVGDLDVYLTGLGSVFNWFVSMVTSWVVGLYRDQVLQQLESKYEEYGREVFATYNIDELIDGGEKESLIIDQLIEGVK